MQLRPLSDCALRHEIDFALRATGELASVATQENMRALGGRLSLDERGA